MPAELVSGTMFAHVAEGGGQACVPGEVSARTGGDPGRAGGIAAPIQQGTLRQAWRR